MRRMKLLMILVIFGGILVGPSESEAAVNAGVLFLRIAAGARAAGMGETFVGQANDATATHWNPAGLGDYPLNSQWDEFLLPSYGSVRDAAMIKNGLPYEGPAAYDLWILTDQGLLVFGATDAGKETPSTDSSAAGNALIAKSRFSNFIKITTAGATSVSGAIRRYAPFLSEAQADDIAARSAAQLLGMSSAGIESLLTRLTEAIPSDYKDRTALETVLRDFRTGYREARLDKERIGELRQALAALPPSGPADLEALDRVRFSMQRSLTNQIPPSVDVAFSGLFTPPIRAIGGDGSRLYVAFGDQFVMFDGTAWDAIAPPSERGWSDEAVNCIEITSGPRLWLGTDHGVLSRLSGDWKRYGLNEGLPGEKVTKLALSGSRSGWVLTDAGLAALSDSTFSGSVALTANVGDSLSSMLRRFFDTDDDVFLARAEKRVISVNGLSEGYVPEPATTVRVPYQLGIRGEVTALALDNYQRLWVGTTLGALRFSQGRWSAPGYVKVVSDEATTAKTLAEKQLGSRATPERIDHFARIIAGYNGLGEDGSIEAGRTVYVYRNPAAAQVNAMVAIGDLFFVATDAGQLQVKSGDWSRYYHRNLERDQVRAIAAQGRDVWFVTNDRVVVYMQPHKEVTLMHANWLPELAPDIYYEYLSYVSHVEGWGTLGAAATFLSYGEILRTDERGQPGNSFHSFDGAFSLSYGTRLSPNLAGGLSAKVIYSRLADQGAGREVGSGSATAFAMDAGLLYHTPWRKLTLGMALTNVGPNISYIDAQQSDPLPRNLALGFAWRVVQSPYNRITLVGELNKELVNLGGGGGSELKQIIYNVGAEYWYGSFIALRGGYIYDQDGSIRTPTLGAGLSYQRFEIDFAYIPSTHDTPLSNTLRVSMTGRF